MSLLAPDRPGVGDRVGAMREQVLGAPSLFDGPGGEPTLDEVLSGAWEGLAAHRAVGCPVCSGEMQPVYSAHGRPIGGRCSGCGTTFG